MNEVHSSGADFLAAEIFTLSRSFSEYAACFEFEQRGFGKIFEVKDRFGIKLPQGAHELGIVAGARGWVDEVAFEGQQHGFGKNGFVLEWFHEPGEIGLPFASMRLYLASKLIPGNQMRNFMHEGDEKGICV